MIKLQSVLSYSQQSNHNISLGRLVAISKIHRIVSQFRYSRIFHGKEISRSTKVREYLHLLTYCYFLRRTVLQ
jgi:hypothetical protein